MKKFKFSNYKTTLAGFLTGCILPVFDMLQKGSTDRKTLLLSFGMAFIGWFAHDAEKK